MSKKIGMIFGAFVVGFLVTFCAKLIALASTMDNSTTIAMISLKEWINVFAPAISAAVTTSAAYWMKSPKGE